MNTDAKRGRLEIVTKRSHSNPEPVAFVDDGLGNSSYLVDLGDGRALVVDPARHPGGYLAEAERRGLDIAFTVETHIHADFVSGAPSSAHSAPRCSSLARPVTGSRSEVSPTAKRSTSAALTLRGLATPGHTPEHLSYLLLDGATPLALFSGGSLMVGAVARTDLLGPDQTEALARELWRSLHERILTLPDDLPVYPTHGAGSFCSAPAARRAPRPSDANAPRTRCSPRPTRTRSSNSFSPASAPIRPTFCASPSVNRAGPRLYGPATPPLPLLSTGDVARLERGGTLVVDARPVDAFARGHIPGAVSIALRPLFASWLGWLAAADTPLVFVLDDDQDRAELVRQSLNIGYETILGELDGGINAWIAAGNAVDTTALVAGIRARAGRARRPPGERVRDRPPARRGQHRARVARVEQPARRTGRR